MPAPPPKLLSDSERLRTLFKQRSGDKTQAKFGKEFGLGTAGMVWQYLHGRAPLNVSAAKKFAIGLGVSVADFSPSLAKRILEDENGYVVRVTTSFPIRPELRGAMLKIHAERNCGAKSVKIYEIYEEAIQEYVKRHCST
jgi:transcriptional regulator with XRE-family HTH domain